MQSSPVTFPRASGHVQEVQGSRVGMVRANQWHRHGMVLVCIISLVFECCKVECGEVSVFDKVGKVGED